MPTAPRAPPQGLLSSDVQESLTDRRPFLWIYGLAHFGKSLQWYSSELLFAYFLTEMCGLRPVAMGEVLAVSLVFSGAVDLAVGHAMSARAPSLGDLCRVQLLGAVGSGLTLVAFSGTGLVPDDVRFLYAVATSCLFRLAYTFYDLPQNAVLSLVRTDIDGRLQISAVRLGFSGLATVLVAMAAALLTSSTATASAERFVGFSVLLMLAGSVSALALRRVSPPPARADVPVQPGQTERRLDATRQRVWLILMLFFFIGGATSVFSRLESYFSAAALPSYGARTMVLTLIALGGALGQPLWMAVSRRIPTHHSLRWSALVTAMGAAVFLLCAGQSTTVAALAGAAYGCGLGGLNMLLWGLLAAEAAPEQRRPGLPAAPLAFGLLTSTVKLATAFAVVGVSALLASVDYHNPQVAGSLTFLAPMAAAPLLAAVICYLAAPVLAGTGKRRRVTR